MAKRRIAGAKSQVQRFKEAAREAGAGMTKEDFARVISGLAKPEPPATDEKPDADQASGE